MEHATLWLLGFLLPAIGILGFVTAIHAVLSVRSSQGAIAWSIALITLPVITLPLYWVFGRNRFRGYVQALRQMHPSFDDIVAKLRNAVESGNYTMPRERPEHRVFEKLARMPFTRGNEIDLLIDGEATFDAIFAAIEGARSYILVQFYIIRDDRIGRELQRRLIARARDGLRVHVLYDEIGSLKLSGSYIDELRDAGVEIVPFHTTRGFYNRFQLNFRNHRKIVVVDGRVAFIGGLNVGDEYLGRSERFGHWRDTHLRIIGPAAVAAQVVFVEDWHWATGERIALDWTPEQTSTQDKTVLVVPSGPSDSYGSCGLLFIHAIDSARERIWITSPYFVPDERITGALQLAAMRGVDVRIILPERPDHYLVYLASFAFIPEAEELGIRFFRYGAGFMHHKVMLIDDRMAAVGTANLDNRSLCLNFEVTVLVDDDAFAAEVAAMLERDLEQCRQETASEYGRRSIWFRAAVSAARLASPIL